MSRMLRTSRRKTGVTSHPRHKGTTTEEEPSRRGKKSPTPRRASKTKLADLLALKKEGLNLVDYFELLGLLKAHAARHARRHIRYRYQRRMWDLQAIPSIRKFRRPSALNPASRLFIQEHYPLQVQALTRRWSEFKRAKPGTREQIVMKALGFSFTLDDVEWGEQIRPEIRAAKFRSPESLLKRLYVLWENSERPPRPVSYATIHAAVTARRTSK